MSAAEGGASRPRVEEDPGCRYMPANRPRVAFDCYACGSTARWRREDGGLVCAHCHPPPVGIPVLWPRPGGFRGAA